eukprot:565639-Prorocentrum_lima.AAC.1
MIIPKTQFTAEAFGATWSTWAEELTPAPVGRPTRSGALEGWIHAPSDSLMPALLDQARSVVMAQ